MTSQDKVRDKLREQLYFDFYGELLTDRLKTVLTYYYNDDYSAPEIAEITGMTRQGAYDALKRGRGQLRRYESKLGLAARFEKGKALLSGIAEEMSALLKSDGVQHDAALEKQLMTLSDAIRRFADEF